MIADVVMAILRACYEDERHIHAKRPFNGSYL